MSQTKEEDSLAELLTYVSAVDTVIFDTIPFMSTSSNWIYVQIRERILNGQGRAWGGGQGVLTPPKFWKAPFDPPKFYEKKKLYIYVYNNNKE